MMVKTCFFNVLFQVLLKSVMTAFHQYNGFRNVNMCLWKQSRVKNAEAAIQMSLKIAAPKEYGKPLKITCDGIVFL